MRIFTMVLAATAALLAGCANKAALVAPEVLVSPYNTAGGGVLWAVAPLANESGTSIVDSYAVTDAVIARAAEVRGITTLPLNRTIAAMRALRMNAIRSPADALRLADALGVDGIIVGSITAYDPYSPPKLGLMLGLYTRASRRQPDWDPRTLQTSGIDRPVQTADENPSVVIAEHLDAQNHEVLMNVRRYAEGRYEQDSALGWRRYTASMELYTEFAAYWSVYRLLQEERLRVARTGVATVSVSR